MTNWLKISILLVLAATTLGNEESTSAKLLFSKQILNKYLVEGMDIVIRYSLFNVGGSAALDVQIADNTFGLQDFEVVGGQLKVAIDRIAPGANATHVAVIRPLRYGYFNFTSAEVSYLPSEDAAEPIIGFSSEPGQGAIVPFREYDRKFSPHMLDWAAFAVMTLPSLVIPFLLWFSSKSKYEAIMKQKKDSKKGDKEN
nr:EOG090X0EPM [Leptodora kindtii]